MITKRPSFLISIAVCGLLLPEFGSAQTTSFTATGRVNGLPTPGLVCTNAGGQVLLRGVVHTFGMQSSDARLTGQALSIGQGGYNADGTANVQGTAYVQVGIWDAAGAEFTPTSGMWEVPWRGVMQADNSMQCSLVGHGSGGTIDGFRLEGTLTRGPASAPVDPAVPYSMTGTIKPPPVSTNLFSDEFANGAQGWTLWGVGSFDTVNQQLVAQTDGTSGSMHLLRGPTGNWSLADGQTLECQADLVRISPDGADFARLWVGNDDAAGYELDLGPGAIDLLKWDFLQGMRLTCFWATNNLPWQRTNPVLYLALTRDEANLIITARVLDKANPGAILLERTFIDTPGVDPSLTQTEFANLTGAAALPVFPDSGAPLLSGTVGGVGLYQSDAGPAVEAVWDNFVLRVQDVPALWITRAVQVSWPAPAGLNYSLESAPSVRGPWLPVQDQIIPGFRTIAVPATRAMEAFRVIQAP